MTDKNRTPSELRSMFGSNLRYLALRYPSISELSRQLAINRTQFNRYLSGESFPRPDVLARICDFFDVDARILLEPVEKLLAPSDPLNTPLLAEFVGTGARNIPEEVFPNGFYRFSRRSFLSEDQFIVGLVFVGRQSGTTFLRGYEAKEAMRQQGLPDDTKTREFRGLILRQEDGVAAIISRRNATTASLNYLSRVASFENNYWVGYVARTIRENVNTTRITRLVFEHLGSDFGEARKVASSTGLVSRDDLLPYHRRLLQPDEPFR